MKKANQNKQKACRSQQNKDCGKMCGGKCCNESGQYNKD